MLNTIYRLVAPKRFEVAFENEEIHKNTIVVRPTYLSICHADQRYFQGLRPPQVLEKKLPMALIHEGIGEVVYSEDENVAVGERVVMIPNIPTEEDAVIAENYLQSSEFRSSGYDGLLQEYVYTCGNRIVTMPSNVPNEVGAFTELASVGCHAVRRFQQIAHKRRRRIGVWGDGNLGYIVALLLQKMEPQAEIVVVGTNMEKLSTFTFAHETYLTHLLPRDLCLDHSFECVGGQYAEQAINQMIHMIEPEGTISLLGVSELKVGINTRMVLEKGLRLFGSSRSGREDFLQLLDIMENHEDVVEYLTTLVNEVVDINSLDDISGSFAIDMHKQMGKTILKWNI